MYNESGAHDSILTKPRHRHSVRVDFARAFRLGQVADRCDALTTHADIGLPRLRAAAVIDCSVANDDVVFRRGRLDLAGSQAQKQNRHGQTRRHR